MVFRRFFNRNESKRTASRRSRQKPANRRPLSLILEQLEDRRLLAGANLVFDADSAGTPILPPFTYRNDGNADTFEVFRAGDNLVVNLTTIAGTTTVYNSPLSLVNSLIINGSNDNDTLRLHAGINAAIPIGGMLFNGLGQTGGTGDDLEVIGGGGSGSYQPSGTTNGDGVITLGDRTLTFSDLEPVLVTGMSEFTFITPNSDDLLVVDSPAAGQNRITGFSGGIAFEEITFNNVTNFKIDAATNNSTLAGAADSVTFNSDLVAVGLASFTVETGGGKDVVNASNVTTIGVTLLGGDGDDSLIGGTNDDRLEGGAGRDDLNGGAGNDTMLGGDDADVFNPGTGNDRVDGGGGSDLYELANEYIGGTHTLVRDSFNRVEHSVSGGDTKTFTDIERVSLADTGGGASLGIDDLAGLGVENILAQNFDSVTVVGSSVADQIGIAIGSSGRPAMTTRWGRVELNSTGTLTVNGLEGDDTIEGDPGIIGAHVTGLVLNGGEGNDYLSGDVTINGGAGNDTLVGSAAADSLDGGAGDDWYYGNGGADTVNDISGNDTYVATGGSYSITDSAGIADTILATGTAAADTIVVAEVGGDIAISVNGLVTGYITPASIDLIRIDAGDGDDQVTLSGAFANKVVEVFGGLGNDALDAAAATTGVSLYGGDGDDILGGGSAADRLEGGAGLDGLTGRLGDDTLLGGDDADTILGGVGNDVVEGGAGQDLYRGLLDYAAGVQTLTRNNNIVVFIAGADLKQLTGVETIDIASGAGATLTVGDLAGTDVSLLLASAFDAVEVRGSNVADNISIVDEVVALTAPLIRPTVTTGWGKVALNLGGPRTLTINGFDGNDTIVADAGVVGGAAPLLGGVVLNGGDGDDYLSGDVTINGGNGNDTLVGSAAADSLDGGAGDDWYYGNGGADIVADVSGNDTYVSNLITSGGSYAIADSAGIDDRILVQGTGVNDVITVSEAAGVLTVTINGITTTFTGIATVDQILVDAGDGNDTVTISGAPIGVEVLGGLGNDTVNASAATTALLLYGGAGDDSLAGGSGADRLEGGAGLDSLNGGAANDTVLGGDDADFIFMAVGANTDVVDGGDGLDVLNFDVGAGLYTVFAANGSNVGSVSAGGGSVGTTSVEEFNLGATATSFQIFDLTGTSVAKVNLSAVRATVGAGTFSPLSGDVTVEGTQFDDQITGGDDPFFNPSIQTGWGSVAFDTPGVARTVTVNGQGGDDRIVVGTNMTLTNLNIVINGGAGNDYLSGDVTINGGAGDDTLVGAASSDSLDGGAGNDTYIGNGGTDTVNDTGPGAATDPADTILVQGTAGNDTIIVAEAAGVVTVTINAVVTTYIGTVNTTIERILVDAGDGNDTITITGAPVGVEVLGGLGNDTINGSGVTTTALRLYGGAGNDSISAGGGADHIDGEAGEDTINGGAGADVLLGGDDADFFTHSLGLDTVDGGDGDDVLNADGTGAYIVLATFGSSIVQVGVAGVESGYTSVEELNLGATAGPGTTFTVFDLTGTDVEKVQLGATRTGLAGTINPVPGGVTIEGSQGDDQIIGSNDAFLNQRILMGWGMVVFRTPAAPSITLSLLGQEGNDSVVIDPSMTLTNVNVNLDGGNGNDYVSTAGATLVSATLAGGAGNDTLLGAANTDTLNGGDGDDIYYGNGGVDTITDTSGNDTYVANSVVGTYNITDTDSATDADTILLPGVAGNDTFNLILAGGIPSLVATVNGVQTTFSNAGGIGLALIERVLVDGGDGDDSLTVDVTGGVLGATTFAQGIDYEGGNGRDTLTLTGTPAGGIISNTYSVGPAVGQGVSTIVGVGGGATQVVTFNGLEPVIDLVGGPLTVNATPADNSINYAALGANGLISVDNFETLEFGNKTNVTINGGSGADVINIAGTNAGFTGNLTVNGNDGADVLTVNGVAAILGVDTGLSQIAGALGGAQLINYGTIEALTANAGPSTTLAVSGSANYIYTPGGLADAGTVLTDTLPITFTGIGAGETLAFTGIGGADSVIDNGTATNDVFTLLATGAVTQTGRATVTNAGIETLTLNGLDGDDTFNIAAVAGMAVNVNGGDPSASDVLIFNGAGGAITLDLAAQTIQEAGLGLVSLTGVEHLTINALGAALTVAGTAGPDELSYTPTGAADGIVALAGQNLVTNFTAVAGTFTLDPAGGSDTVRVFATSAAETITVSDASVAITGLKTVTLTTANLETLRVYGAAGSDTFNVTASATVPLFIDGGDPIGAFPGDRMIILAAGAATTVNAGPESDEGSVLVGALQLISFDHLESMIIAGSAAGATVNATNDADAITIIARDLSYFPAYAGPGALNGVQDFTVSVNDGVEILYVDAPTFTVNALGGSDEIAVQAPAPNNAVWDVDLTLNGGLPTASDTVIFGTPGVANTVVYAASGSDAGLLTIVDLSSISTLVGIEHLVYDGEGGNDSLTVNGTVGPDVINVTPGAAVDEGAIRANNLLGISYQNLGVLGSIAINGLGSADAVVYNGTDGSDIFTVSNLGVLGLTNTAGVHLNIATTSIELLALDGLDGDDTFNVPGNHPFIGGILVDGGNPSASDELNFTGSGGNAVTVDFGAATVQEATFAAVTFTGVEVLNAVVNNALTVKGTTGDDALDVTPTGALAATVRLTSSNPSIGGSPVVNASAVTGALLVDALAGADTVSVNGTSGTDAIGVARAATTVVTVNALKAISITSGAAESLNILAGAGNDTITVSGTGGTAFLAVDGGGPDGSSGIDSDRLVYNAAAGVTTVSPGSTPDAGLIDAPAANPVDDVAFSGMEFLTINGTGAAGDTLIMQGTQGTDSIATQNLGGNNLVWVNDRAVTTFTAFPTLTLSGRFGDDSFSVTPVGLVGVTAVNVDGGDPTASDDVLVNGTINPEIITVAGLTVNGATVQVGAAPLVTVTTSESLRINGLGGNDNLFVTTPAGAQTITYTPGVTVDSASMQIASLIPLAFQGIGPIGSVNLTDLSGVRTDTLVYQGTDVNDTFGVAAGTGAITLNSQVVVNTVTGVANLVLNGLDGDDTFNVPGNHPYTTFAVNGDDPSASDVLNFTGSGGNAVTVNFGAATVQEATFAAVSHTGVEVLNAIANNNLTVLGTAGADSLDVTPTGAASATVRLTSSDPDIGSSPVVNASAIGATFTVDAAGAADTVTVNGTSGADTIAVIRGATTTVQVGAFKVVSLPAANTEALVIASGLGDDTINVSGAAGPASLTVDGGLPTTSDTLTITNTATGATTVTPGSTPDSGTVANPDGTVSFVAIESITITAAVGAGDTLNMLGTHDNDTMATQNLGGADRVWVNDRAVVTFSNFETLALNGRFGDDAFNVSPVGMAAGLTSITVTGGDSTTGDSLVVNGSAAANVVNITPTAPDAGGVAITGAAPVTFTTTESLVYNGLGGNDALTVTTPAGLQNITYTPGTTVDSASMQVASLVPIAFQGLGATGTVSLADTGGARTDTLVYQGTAVNDTFGVAAVTGAITLNSQVVVSTPGIANLVLNGLDGDDTFNVPGNHPFTTFAVNGDDPSASDVLNFTGSGANPVTVNFGAATVQEATFAAISHTGVEVLNAIANNNLTVLGTAGADALDVTPTGAAAATVRLTSSNPDIGSSPVVNASAIGATFTIDPLAGADTVTVNGTSGADAIIVARGATTVVTVNAFKAVSITSANAESLNILAGTGNDTITVGGTGGTAFLAVDGGGPDGSSGGTDRLIVNAAAGTTAVSPGSTPDAGLINAPAPNPTDDVSFFGMEDLTINGTGALGDTLDVLGTQGSDTIAVDRQGGANQVWVNDRAVITFTAFPTLDLRARSGDDSISVSPVGLVGVTAVFVRGNDPSASDSVLVNGSTGADAIAVAALSVDGATVQVTGAPLVTIDTSESILINGRGGNDALTVTTPAGLQNITYTPGATVDSASLQIASLVPLAFQGLGATGTVSLADVGGARTDTLVYQGTNANDTFGVTAVTGAIALNAQVVVSTPGVIGLTLNGFDGDDTFNVPGNHPYTAGILVSGGNPSASDVLNFTGSAANPVTVNFGASTVQETTFAAVSFSSVEVVNAIANNLLNVVGTANDDDITVTVFSATSGKVQQGFGVQQLGQVAPDLLAPVVNYTNATAPLNVDLAAGDDTLIVVGNALSQTFNINANALPTLIPGYGVVGPNRVDVDDNNNFTLNGSVTYLNNESLAVYGLEGNDTFNVVPGSIPVFVDGGDPIGNTPGDLIQIFPAIMSAVVFEPGPESDEGGFRVGVNERVSFDHIEAAVVNGPVCAIVVGTNADDDITIIARTQLAAPPQFVGADGVRDFTTTVNAGPEILWLNVDEVLVDGLSGDDDITVQTRALDANGAAIAADWNVHVRIVGGPPSAPQNGDRVVVQTPGSDNVFYTPNGADTGSLLLDVTNDGLNTFTAATDTLIELLAQWIEDCDPLVVGDEYRSSNGGVEHLVYDGEGSPAGASDSMTIVATAGADIIDVTPGAARDEGAIRVNNLLGISYQNLGFGAPAPIAIEGQGAVDRVVYNGTSGNDAFSVSTTGVLGLTSTVGVHLPITTSGLTNIEALTFNALDGDDTFSVAGSALFTSGIIIAAGDPSGSDSASLFGTAAANVIDLSLNFLGDTVTGVVGGPVLLVGVENLTIDSLAGADTLSVTNSGNPSDLDVVNFLSGNDATDTLTVNGTAIDDTVTYTPTSATTGTFTAAGGDTVFNFSLNAASTAQFTINGGAAGISGDSVVVVGTNNHDVITIDQGARSGPAPTVIVENAAGTVLKGVVLATTVETVNALGRLGNDTFLVIPAVGIGVAGTNVVGPGFVLPYNLLVYVDGGAPGASDALVVAGAGGIPLAADLFAVVNRGRNPNEGVVRIFQDQPGAGNEPIQFPDIIYTDVEVVSPITTLNAGEPQTLILGADVYEPNEFRTNAAFIGAGDTLNVTNLSVFPNAFEHRFLVTDQDFFRFTAEETGILDIQVYFNQIPEFLPGSGNLQIEVRDKAGNIITGFGVNDFAGSLNADERRRIPVVANETYYVQVFGLLTTTVNAYSISVVNTVAPTPYDLELDDNIAFGTVVAGASTVSFTGNAALSAVDDFYNGKMLTFTGVGTLATQRSLVLDYVGATRTFTLATPVTAIPAAGATFIIDSTDTGRSQFDNHTRDNTPTIFLRLEDDILLNDLRGGGAGNAPPDNQVIPIPFRGSAALATLPGYRIAIFDEVNTQAPVFMGFADQVAGQPGVYTFTFTTPLVDGSHFITAKVQIVDPSIPLDNDFGPVSQSLEIVVDTSTPPVTFGAPNVTADGLHPSSDSGVLGQPPTNVDRITNDTTPSFFGAAEANGQVRLYVDLNNNGVVDSTDLFIGQGTAVPTDGSNQFPFGQWNITSVVDLNNPAYFPVQDGVRRILVTSEDLAGNVSPADSLIIFLDTRGPQINNVGITGNPGFDLFAVKSGTLLPTPLVNSIDIFFVDQPVRVNAGAGNVFVYPAVNLIEATTIGNYRLIGDATGDVVIVSAVAVDTTVAGGIGMTRVTLTFAAALPDDRFTLVVSDRISDDPGNPLDGEFPVFITGDGTPGGEFIRRFTVDTRPEIAVYSSGTVSVDINGNFILDPQNVDATNRDLVFNLGFATDRLIAGQFTAVAGVNNGFDRLGAYGFVNGAWRVMLDFNDDGIPDFNQVTTLQIDGMPLAGNFSAGKAGDEFGVFTGTTWYLDSNGNNNLDGGDLVLAGGNMRGLPIAGDFDGDNVTDLGTYANGQFYFDLGANGLSGNADQTVNFRFDGVLTRPVAADMNADGITDIGLWVPGRSEQIDRVVSEWYFLVSTSGVPTPGLVTALNHPFNTVPFGTDLHAFFGDEFALPLLGNFDPPLIPGIPGTDGGGGGGGDGGATSSGWLQNLYTDVLGRPASTTDYNYWAHAVEQGMSFTQVAETFMYSRERRAGIIDALYQQYLGRASDAAGVDYWISVWDKHGGPEHVQAGIIGSPEFYVTAGNTDAAWVTALYQNVLNRQVDQKGLDHWVKFIKTNSKESVVLGFVTSDEYRLGMISGWFTDYLNRSLDNSGAQYWLRQMKGGLQQEEIQIGILASSEYRARA